MLPSPRLAGNDDFPIVFRGFRITVIFTRFLGRCPGPDADPARRGFRKRLFSQGFAKGATKDPGFSAEWLRRPAADALVAVAGIVSFTKDF